MLAPLRGDAPCRGELPLDMALRGAEAACLELPGLPLATPKSADVLRAESLRASASVCLRVMRDPCGTRLGRGRGGGPGFQHNQFHC